MHIDYRKLCVELFGTDDVTELRNIAQTVNQKNARNAGRKKKFTAKEISEIRKLLDHGVTINEIAERYGTSRQIISCPRLRDFPDQRTILRHRHMGDSVTVPPPADR